MGQARNRGTKAERVAMAIASKKKARAEAERLAREAWANMTEEERQAEIAGRAEVRPQYTA